MRWLGTDRSGRRRSARAIIRSWCVWAVSGGGCVGAQALRDQVGGHGPACAGGRDHARSERRRDEPGVDGHPKPPPRHVLNGAGLTSAGRAARHLGPVPGRPVLDSRLPRTHTQIHTDTRTGRPLGGLSSIHASLPPSLVLLLPRLHTRWSGLSWMGEPLSSPVLDAPPPNTH